MAGANDTIRSAPFTSSGAWFDRTSHPSSAAAIIIIAIATRRRIAVAAFNLTQRNYRIDGTGLSTRVTDAVCIHVPA